MMELIAEESMPEFDEDRYLDVLQNIEFAIIEVYRSDPDLLDTEVEQALRGVVIALNAKRLAKPFDLERMKLTERGKRVYLAVQEIVEWRIRGRLGGVAPDSISYGLEDMIACIQRVRKSVRRWTRVRGRRGYLRFVEEYLP
jgi:hypothetical protein